MQEGIENESSKGLGVHEPSADFYVHVPALELPVLLTPVQKQEKRDCEA